MWSWFKRLVCWLKGHRFEEKTRMDDLIPCLRCGRSFSMWDLIP